jgi:heat-inducible transcriptional repressor
MTRGASIVLAPKHESAPIRHMEFVSAVARPGAGGAGLSPMARWKTGCSSPPPGQTPSAMREAANFLNAMAEGRSLADLRRIGSGAEIAAGGKRLIRLARELVESGLAVWENAGESSERLIVRGRAQSAGRRGKRCRCGPHPQPVR